MDGNKPGTKAFWVNRILIGRLKSSGVIALILTLSFLFVSILLRVSGRQADVRSSLLPPDALAKPQPISSASCLPGVLVYGQTKNLVRNPSFEDEIPRSGEWMKAGDCDFDWDCAESYDGDCSAGITSTTYTADCAWITPWKNIEVSPGRYYDFSGRIKADFAPGSQEVHLAVMLWDSNGNSVGQYCPVAIAEDTDDNWLRVTGSVRTPSSPGPFYASVYCRVRNAPGEFWFDDIFFGLATSLEIEKQGNSPDVRPGERLTYTIVYTNVGREAANAVKILEDYDDHVSNPTSDPTPTWGDYEWSVGALNPNDSGIITVAVQVGSDTGEACTLANLAKIESRETEITISDIETTTIQGCPNGCDVSVLPHSDEKLAYPGKMLYYHTIVNTGNCSGTVAIETSSFQGFDSSVVPLTSPLELNQEIGSITTITIPASALSGTVDSAIVTATLACLGDAKTAMDTSILTTKVKCAVGVDISPGRTQAAPPTGGIAFTHEITNTGNWTDTVDLMCDFDPKDLQCKVSSSPVVLDPGASKLVTVELSDISCGCHTFTVTASSRADNTRFREVVDKVTRSCIYLPSVMLRSYCCPWTDENNNSRKEALGPLQSGIEYCCFYPEDGNDYFYFLKSKPGLVRVDVTDYLAEKGDLMLYRDGQGEPVDWWGRLHGTAEHMWLEVQHGQGMNPRYYVRVYTCEGSCTTDGPYCITVTY